MLVYDSFVAMNTSVDTIIAAPTPVPWLTASVRLLFARQEERFSRFRASSLVSRLNAGETVADPWLAAACRLALDAHAFTGGLFNPMVLPALEDAGYGTTFEAVRGGRPRAQAVPGASEALVLEGDSVRLLTGRLDLGGVVKGWTADLAAQAMIGECRGAFVNAGGDIRCVGGDEDADGWPAEVDAPSGAGPVWAGRVRAALSTSTTLRRRWPASDGSVAHHLIDPRTGLPAASPFVQVSVWAETAWRAECWAKAVLIGGEEALELVSDSSLDVLLVDLEGKVRFVPARP